MLNLHTLFESAKEFARDESSLNHVDLIGVTDGKAVGTYVEHRFQTHLLRRFPDLVVGNSASGIDLPDSRINCDLKVTSLRQPQSSCPFKSTGQKLFGLGYNILVFVYKKDDTAGACSLQFEHVALIEDRRTADYLLTKMVNEMVAAGANDEDLVALFNDKNLPGDEIVLQRLAEEVLVRPPAQGYLTISNALQWRLQYKRVISLANTIEGVSNYDR